jgi:hypothetical protein
MRLDIQVVHVSVADFLPFRIISRLKDSRDYQSSRGGCAQHLHLQRQVTLQEGGTVLYTATRTFASTSDLSSTYTKTYTLNGETYTLTAVVTCTH